jgi:hypothetical protein
MAVTRYRVPWARFIPADCACALDAPCLLHFNGLDWQGRAAAFATAGVQPSTGR